jgi:hypothetical protein
MEKILLEAVRSRLEEFGITLTVKSGLTDMGAADHGVDALIELSTDHAHARYAAVIKKKMTLTAVAHLHVRSPHPILAIGEHIDSRSAAAFRDAGIQYADAAGNAFIRFSNVAVEVRGRRAPRSLDAVHGDPGFSSTGAVGNMFSTRRSQTIMALLAWPELWSASVRDLATAAGVSTGQAHDTLSMLQNAGFRLSSSVDQRRHGELLDFWTIGYGTGLGPKLALASYSGDVRGSVKKSHPGQAIYLSGESASGIDLVRPATVTIYIADPDPKLPMVNRWRRDPALEPNIFVRRKFWTSPRQHDEVPVVKAHNAPWPLIYADLMATGDARLAEVARTWGAQFV